MPRRVWPSDERGSALVFVVILLLVLLAIGSLAVDLGMLYAARAEAQRAADAAALAGASAFAEPVPNAADSARARALAYAALNPIQRTPVRPEEMAVHVDLDSAIVRVRIRRGKIGTFFARSFGVDSAAVSARATAWAQPAPRTTCVKPFAPPDMWADADDDLNVNRLMDNGEVWKFDERMGDRFAPYTGNRAASPPETGYFSVYRGADRDFGRQIVIKITDADLVQVPGYFYLWQMDPVDANGNQLREQIRNCYNQEVEIGQSYKLLGGDRQGTVYLGVKDLIAKDPGAYWDATSRTVRNSLFTPWWTSPRVVKIPFYDPRTLKNNKQVKFSHFSWVFVEDMATSSDPVLGRYINYVRVLKLIE
jgi:hypothetical protein